MLKIILSVSVFLFCSFSFGQTASKDLTRVNTVSQAKTFIETNPKASGKLFTLESGSDTSELLLPLYEKKVGFTFRIDNINYKILQIDSTLSFRVNYIYLNADQLSKNQIDSLRQEIISKYKAGTSFYDLVQQYNMDGNTTGDTRWFTENMMVKEFENAVRQHKQGEIFTVDTPAQNWYHVVLKTYNDTFIKTLKLISAKGTAQP